MINNSNNHQQNNNIFGELKVSDINYCHGGGASASMVTAFMTVGLEEKEKTVLKVRTKDLKCEKGGNGKWNDFVLELKNLKQNLRLTIWEKSLVLNNMIWSLNIPLSNLISDSNKEQESDISYKINENSQIHLKFEYKPIQREMGEMVLKLIGAKNVSNSEVNAFVTIRKADNKTFTSKQRSHDKRGVSDIFWNDDFSYKISNIETEGFVFRLFDKERLCSSAILATFAINCKSIITDPKIESKKSVELTTSVNGSIKLLVDFHYIPRKIEETINLNDLQTTDYPTLFPGEEIRDQFKTDLIIPSLGIIDTICYLTTCAIHFKVPKKNKKTYEKDMDSESENQFTEFNFENEDFNNYCLTVYIPAIAQITRNEERDYETVEIFSRDLREFKLRWPNSSPYRKRFLNHCSTYQPLSKLEYYFGYNLYNSLKSYHNDNLGDQWTKNGYVRFHPEKEFKRIVGFKHGKHWQISKLNESYNICESYPSSVYIPSTISDESMSLVAGNRSKGRFPTMCWIHPQSGGSLHRSSQPFFTTLQTLKEDQKYLAFLASRSSTKRLHIIDARSRISAHANMAIGGGVEGAGYENSEVRFLGIDKIDEVRESWKIFVKNCHKEYSSDNWYKIVSESKWLNYILLILNSGMEVAKLLEKGASVLVHCSDGWDRTVQIVSLAMLLSDPYYRTINGFELLIEKEWLSFGHQFHLRQGLEGNPQAEAPIFLQFLECVWNCTRLFPEAFEFNEDFLIAIFDHSYSGAFGTFFLNSEKERVSKKIWKKTPSLWLYLDQNKKNYTNYWYKPAATSRLSLSSIHMRHIQIWERLFLRFDTQSFPNRSSNFFSKRFPPLSESQPPQQQQATPNQSIQQSLLNSSLLFPSLSKPTTTTTENNSHHHSKHLTAFDQITSFSNPIISSTRDLIIKKKSLKSRTDPEDSETSEEYKQQPKNSDKKFLHSNPETPPSIVVVGKTPLTMYSTTSSSSGSAAGSMGTSMKDENPPAGAFRIKWKRIKSKQEIQIVPTKK